MTDKWGELKRPVGGGAPWPSLSFVLPSKGLGLARSPQPEELRLLSALTPCHHAHRLGNPLLTMTPNLWDERHLLPNKASLHSESQEVPGGKATRKARGIAQQVHRVSRCTDPFLWAERGSGKAWAPTGQTWPDPHQL